MPCNIGYKSFARVRIPTPQPQKFKSKAKAPTPDAELLERIGVSDPKFIEWLMELDIVPLLQEALRRTLEKVDAPGIDCSIAANGDLIMEGEYRNAAKKKALASTVTAVSSRWQAEALSVIVQLLDYETAVQAESSGRYSVKGEKQGEGQVHEYISITRDGQTDALRFEHFASINELQLERAKFLALAQKFGIKIQITESQENGQPIPTGAVHRDFLRHRQGGK